MVPLETLISEAPFGFGISAAIRGCGQWYGPCCHLTQLFLREILAWRHPMLLLIILLIVLFGGGGGYYGYRSGYYGGGGLSIVSIVLIILLIWIVMGGGFI